MSEKNRELVASLIFIVIGIFSLFQDIKAGVLLIVTGLGINSQVRGWIKTLIEISVPYIKRLFGESESTQKINHVRESVSLQAGRDIKAGRDVHINIKNQPRRKRVK